MTARPTSTAIDRESPEPVDSELLSELAHELRNPLAPLTNCLQVVEESQRRRAECGRALAVMKRQIERLSRLADELSDAASASQRQIKLRCERMMLDDLVRRAIEVSARPRPQVVRLPDAPVALEADPIRLPRVLTMLLDSIPTEPSRRALVSAIANGEHVEIRIVSEREPTARVVDLFAEGASTRARVSRSVIEHIIALHGGTIAAFGNGYCVRLPLSPA